MALLFHRELDHPNLSKFIGGSIEVPYVSIITEYCPKGSLADVLLNEDVPINWGFRWMSRHQLFLPFVWRKNTGLYRAVSWTLPSPALKAFPLNMLLSLELGSICVRDHDVIEPNSFFLCSSFMLAHRLSFATDIARGMAYLHQHKMFHGRLHSRNCVIDDRWVCKISGDTIKTSLCRSV